MMVWCIGVLSYWMIQAPVAAGDEGLAFARLAIETAAQRDVEPIPLTGRRGEVHALVYDRFRLTVVAARAAAASGRPLDPAAPSADLLSPMLVIVAVPLGNDGQSNTPRQIQLFDKDRRPVAPIAHNCGASVADMLPDVKVAPLACAATFERRNLGPDDAVHITYLQAVGPGMASVVSLAVKLSPPRKTRHVDPHLPPNQPLPTRPVVVRIAAWVDLDGMVRYPRVVKGPPHFADAALETVGKWRFEPPRMNGAPVPMTLTVTYGR